MITSGVSIGDYGFVYCSSIETIVIPDSMTSIGHSVFRRCTSLTSLTVSENNLVYHSSGNCLIETESKTLIGGVNSSVIPSDGSVTSIGFYAFRFCTIESIVIPKNVTYIDDGAFSACELLTDIYYMGSESEWNAIDIDARTFPSTVTIHYNHVPTT